MVRKKIYPARAELYVSATGEWTSSGTMTIPRDSPIATLLNYGKVLVTGGYNNCCELDSAKFHNLPPPPTSRSVGAYDGYILESTESGGMGLNLNSTNTTFQVGDDNYDFQYRAILSFSTSALPDNAVINKVTLKIRKQGVVGTDPLTTHGRLIVDIRKPFFDMTVGLVVIDFQAPTGKSAVGSFRARTVNNWFSTLLGYTAYPYINPTGNTQFRLRFIKDDNDDTSADFVKFLSRDYGTTSLRPTIIIEYYIP